MTIDLARGLSRQGSPTAGLTDYQAELKRLDDDIARRAPMSRNIEDATFYAQRLFQRASLTGNLAELEDAESLIVDVIGQASTPGDLFLLQARIAFKFHRLTDVLRSLRAASPLLEIPEGLALLADLNFQYGRYDDARAGYRYLVDRHRTWDNLARLAYFDAKMGDAWNAERLYLEAEDELTAKEMRQFAWLELQRGLLHLSRGRYGEARSHYERADRAYSGYWLVREHMAELLGAERRFGEAIELYEDVVADAPRPEFYHALAELHRIVGRPDSLGRCRDAAQAAYVESVNRGEVHYYHHLVDFFLEVVDDVQEAIQWARQDVALRNNFSTQSALAAALHRDGQYAEALAVMKQALASGVQDAHIFSHAALIHHAAGMRDAGNSYAQKAMAINPRYGDFHVHR